MKIGRKLPNTVHQRTIEEKNLKLKFVLYFFLFSKNGQNGFLILKIVKKMFYKFRVFAFKQAEEQTLLMKQP